MALLGKTRMWAAGAILALTATEVQADWALNFQPPATSMAREILNLHNGMMVLCLVIAALVFSVMFYAMYAHRKSRGHEAARFHHSTRLEIIWTVIPSLILVGVSIPSTATLLRIGDTSNSAMTVLVTGYQWKWNYDYPAQKIDFYSTLSTPRAQIDGGAPKDAHYLLEVDHPLVLPAGKKVKLQITGADVVHSWWVPAFGVKMDAIPGHINETWVNVDKPGIYRGQCAELCGKDHGFMPIVVKVVTPDEFDQWIKDQRAGESAPAAISGAADGSAVAPADPGHGVASAGDRLPGAGLGRPGAQRI